MPNPEYIYISIQLQKKDIQRTETAGILDYLNIHTNLKIENFLDVTLNLCKGTYETYKKR